MTHVDIPWVPRIVLKGRPFRVPVVSSSPDVDLRAEGFSRIADRWSNRENARYFYLRAPDSPGTFRLEAANDGVNATAATKVMNLAGLRRPFEFNGATWPRRWPVGQSITSTKTQQTLQDFDVCPTDPNIVSWWGAQTDEVIWRQLPHAELPQAHFVNAHQGSPTAGTEIFRHGGFYPWRRSFMPCDFKSTCPVSGDVFPSNDICSDDFISGEYPDDGYGYFDADGNVYLFVATYKRDLLMHYDSAVLGIASRLRESWDDGVARRLALMLLRYAQEECYVAAAPQFRYGPSKMAEEPWDWGQPDWGAMERPLESLHRIGSQRYSIDTPSIAETMAFAYDTVWPFLARDTETVERARSLGLEVSVPEDAVQLVEEMLCSLLQCILDRAAGSNLPRESQGALTLLRSLDRTDAQDVMDWLYDEGPDRLRVFATNNFFPDGMPPESTGGYNRIHTDGLFDLEYQIRQLRSRSPESYPETRYPSLMDDPRVPRIARAPHEVTMIGRSWFQYGDGSAPGSASQFIRNSGVRTTTRLESPCLHAPMAMRTFERAVEYTGDPTVREIHEAVVGDRYRALGDSLFDGVGLAIARTEGVPERAAAGIFYGDAASHRHRDLLDVQLFAFERPFLTDLGYPQSWPTIRAWEAHWATHNTVWGTTGEQADPLYAGRGRLIRRFSFDGVHVIEVVADRWLRQNDQWVKSEVSFRRLIALVETDDGGVALVDLSRVHGGHTHWRTCRGPEGTLRVPPPGMARRRGTVAGEEIERGNTSMLNDPDDVALAYLDDVAWAKPNGDVWKATWQSAYEPDVELDAYQLAVSKGTELFSARATAIMGEPQQSAYEFRQLIWKRPVRDGEGSAFDLLFEPRVGSAKLRRVTRDGNEDGVTVSMETLAGRTISIRWYARADQIRSASGVREPDVPVCGPVDSDASDANVSDPDVSDTGIAVTVDGHTARMGASSSAGVERRTIIALDRDRCTIDIESIDGLSVGDLVHINTRRGSVYRILKIDPISSDRMTLTVDMSSALGRSTIAAVDHSTVELSHAVLARTGYLHGAYVVDDLDQSHCRVTSAFNPDRNSTRVIVESDCGPPFSRGAWVRIVDYVIGDELVFEPVSIENV